MADSDFPKAIYKKSDHPHAEPVWGLGTFLVHRVTDLAAEAAALADGWTLRPDDKPQAKPAPVPAKPVEAKSGA